MCQITQNCEADAGFEEVSSSEQEEFSRQTHRALDAGWNPRGRKAYEKFVEENFG